MKRGPPPAKGFERALPIALVRGSVMLFQRLPEHVADFTITGNGILALVRLMTTTRIHSPIGEIAWEYSGAIAGLDSIPAGGPVSRELWLYSRYGSLRFFRVTEAGLAEIDCCGFLFVNGRPVISLPAFPGAAPQPSVPGIALPGNAAGDPVETGSGGSDPYDPKSPIIRRLRKKNARKKPETEHLLCNGGNDPPGKNIPVDNRPGPVIDRVPDPGTVP